MQNIDTTQPDDVDSCPAALYRMFNETGVLLYIGMTTNIGTRMVNHQFDKPWWSEVRTIRVTPYSNRTEAENAERGAIIAEQPLWNEQIREATEGGVRRRAAAPRTRSAMPQDGLVIDTATVTAARLGLASMNPREIRKRAGVTQELMAVRIGLTAAGLSRAEAGTRQPRAETAVRWYRELLKLELLLATSPVGGSDSRLDGAA
jgi:DNA-binding XRE family transcriptional regulator